MDLAKPEDFQNAYKTSIVTLSSTFKNGKPKAFEIQSLMPGDFLMVVGSPIVKRSMQKVLNEGKDVEAIEEDVEAKIEMIKEIVCRGVISINLVNKPQYKCVGDEVSVNMLTQTDLIELYDAIMKLSLEEEEASSFQEQNQS